MSDQLPDASVGRGWRGGAVLPFTVLGRSARVSELHGCPQLVMYIGRDKYSSGVTAWLKWPSQGEYAHQKTIIAERWNDPLPGEEGIVEIAIAALQSHLGKIRGLQDGAAQQPDA